MRQAWVNDYSMHYASGSQTFMVCAPFQRLSTLVVPYSSVKIPNFLLGFEISRKNYLVSCPMQLTAQGLRNPALCSICQSNELEREMKHTTRGISWGPGQPKIWRDMAHPGNLLESPLFVSYNPSQGITNFFHEFRVQCIGVRAVYRVKHKERSNNSTSNCTPFLQVESINQHNLPVEGLQVYPLQSV